MAVGLSRRSRVHGDHRSLPDLSLQKGRMVLRFDPRTSRITRRSGGSSTRSWPPPTPMPIPRRPPGTRRCRCGCPCWGMDLRRRNGRRRGRRDLRDEGQSAWTRQPCGELRLHGRRRCLGTGRRRGALPSFTRRRQATSVFAPCSSTSSSPPIRGPWSCGGGAALPLSGHCPRRSAIRRVDWSMPTSCIDDWRAPNEGRAGLRTRSAWLWRCGDDGGPRLDR